MTLVIPPVFSIHLQHSVLIWIMCVCLSLCQMEGSGSPPTRKLHFPVGLWINSPRKHFAKLGGRWPSAISVKSVSKPAFFFNRTTSPDSRLMLFLLNPGPAISIVKGRVDVFVSPYLTSTAISILPSSTFPPFYFSPRCLSVFGQS